MSNILFELNEFTFDACVNIMSTLSEKVISGDKGQF